MNFAKVCFAAAVGAQLSTSEGASATDALTIDKYTCRQFLDDISQATDGERILHASIFIAWATGYASAFHRDSVRGDAKAFQLVGAAIGDTCKTDPNSFALPAIVKRINDLVAEPGKGENALCDPPPSDVKKVARLNCTNPYRAVDYVICSSQKVIDSEAHLNELYESTLNRNLRLNNGKQLKAEQLKWMTEFVNKCGVGEVGKPRDQDICAAQKCVSDAMNARAEQLLKRR